jgi:alpha-tubulin suppressor-like RCC1 family protein
MRRVRLIGLLIVSILLMLFSTGCESSPVKSDATSNPAPPIAENTELIIQEQNHTIAAGSQHTLGLKTDGMVVATGNNENGQCEVSQWTEIVAVFAGDVNSFGLKADGTLVVSGQPDESEDFGQSDVSQWTNIKAVSAETHHTVGLKTDGTVLAIGYNEYGQCDVSAWADLAAVSAGAHHTVGLKNDGTVVAVGRNQFNQFDVSEWKDIVQVQAGGNTTVGLKKDGTVVWTGEGSSGSQDTLEDFENLKAISGEFGCLAGLTKTGAVIANGQFVYAGYWRFLEDFVSDWYYVDVISTGSLFVVKLNTGEANAGTVEAVGDNEYGQCNVSDWTGIAYEQ